jgi:hypothetical protein
MAQTPMIYQDSLIAIDATKIVFKHYYFPTGKRKEVRLEDIESIQLKPPTIRNGRWRIHGTGNFKTWFPRDSQRPKRDRIFFAKLKGRGMDIGFTVEHADQVERLFGSMGLIKPC